MPKLTKAHIKNYLKQRLAEPAQAVKALMLIYSFQTEHEQAVEGTEVHNNIGFTGFDAEWLSKLAKQYQEREWLSQKQLKCLTKIMPKYWHQVLDTIEYKHNRAILEEQVIKQLDYEQRQTQLQLR